MGTLRGEIHRMVMSTPDVAKAATARKRDDYTVVVGSESKIKLQAVEEALDSLGLVAVNIMSFNSNSFVSQRPVGYADIQKSARNRATQALLSRSDARFGIGIESGLMSRDSKQWFDVTMVSIANISSFHFDVMSALLPIPGPIAIRCVHGGEELGPVIQELSGGGEKDPHTYFSRGLISRKDVIRDAVRMALLPIVNSSLYE